MIHEHEPYDLNTVKTDVYIIFVDSIYRAAWNADAVRIPSVLPSVCLSNT